MRVRPNILHASATFFPPLSPQEKPCDFSLLKTLRLTERLHLSAGANFYNVFNHPNFANPVNDISSGQFGTIRSTVAPPTNPYGVFAGRWIRRFRPPHPIDHSFDFLLPAL